MLKNRHRQAIYDGLDCRDKLDPTAEGLVRSVVIERVDAGTPAALATLQKGDVIVRIGDVAVACSFDVDRALLDRAAGDQVPVLVQRLGQEQKLDLVLQAADRSSKAATPDLVWNKLGLRLSPLGSELVSRVNPQLHGGLEVIQLRGESAAAKAGIKKGDILVGLHLWETLSLENIAYVLTNPDLGSFMPLSFYIIRGGQVRRGWVQQLD
jgi:serine protease Do